MTRDQRKQLFLFQAGGARHIPLSCKLQLKTDTRSNLSFWLRKGQLERL